MSPLPALMCSFRSFTARRLWPQRLGCALPPPLQFRRPAHLWLPCPSPAPIPHPSHPPTPFSLPLGLFLQAPSPSPACIPCTNSGPGCTNLCCLKHVVSSSCGALPAAYFWGAHTGAAKPQSSASQRGICKRTEQQEGMERLGLWRGDSPVVPVTRRAALGCGDPGETAAAGAPAASSRLGTVLLLFWDRRELLRSRICLPQPAQLGHT